MDIVNVIQDTIRVKHHVKNAIIDARHAHLKLPALRVQMIVIEYLFKIVNVLISDTLIKIQTQPAKVN